MSARKAVTVLALLAAACGGDDHPRNRHGRGGRGGTRRDQLAGEAVEKFAQAVQAYQRAEQAGWNDDRCTNVADLFEEAAEEQAGGAFQEGWFNRGMALLFLDRAAEAKSLLRRATELLPESSAWHHLAGLYAALAEMRG